MSAPPGPEFECVFDRGTLVLRRGGGTDGGAGAAGVAGVAGVGEPSLDEPGPTPTAPWVYDGRVDAWRCDAVHYAAVRARWRESGLVVDRVLRDEAVRWPAVRLHALRADQRAAARAWWDDGRRGVVVMPTGTGKTEVALAILARVARSVLVVAPVRALVAQWADRIRSGLGVAPGVVGDGRHEPGPVTVATYDSAALRMEELGGRFALVVFDEVHHLPTRFCREAALGCAAPYRLGLTATPERADGRHTALASLVGPIVHRQAVTAARGRTIADYDVLRVPVALTPDERRAYGAAARAVQRHMWARRQRDDGYAWSHLVAEARSDPAARAVLDAHRARRHVEERAENKLRALEELLVLHADERVLVFAGTNDMALAVSTRFLIPAVLGHTRRYERDEILRGFSEGEFPAIVANRVLDEGVDVPAVKVAVVLGGLRSVRQATQRLGRVLRPQGAARAVLYEVVCVGTTEEARSLARRQGEAWPRARRRRV